MLSTHIAYASRSSRRSPAAHIKPQRKVLLHSRPLPRLIPAKRYRQSRFCKTIPQIGCGLAVDSVAAQEKRMFGGLVNNCKAVPTTNRPVVATLDCSPPR